MADEKLGSQSELTDANPKVVIDEALVEGKLEMALSKAKGFTLLPKLQASQGAPEFAIATSMFLRAKVRAVPILPKPIIAYFIKKL